MNSAETLQSQKFTLKEYFRKKIETYLEKKGTKEAFLQAEKDIYAGLIMDFKPDLGYHKGQWTYFQYLVWRKPACMTGDNYVQLMNEKKVVFDLNAIEKTIKESPPGVQVTSGRRGVTPLCCTRGWITQGTYAYSLLKFIAQSTNDEHTYSECIRILEEMPSELKDVILDPPEVLYLASLNSHMKTTKRKRPTRNFWSIIEDEHYLKYSIFQPNPSWETEYHLEKYQTKKRAHEGYLSAEDANKEMWMLLLVWFAIKNYCFNGLPPVKGILKKIVGKEDAKLAKECFDKVRRS